MFCFNHLPWSLCITPAISRDVLPASLEDAIVPRGNGVVFFCMVVYLKCNGSTVLFIKHYQLHNGMPQQVMAALSSRHIAVWLATVLGLFSSSSLHFRPEKIQKYTRKFERTPVHWYKNSFHTFTRSDIQKSG